MLRIKIACLLGASAITLSAQTAKTASSRGSIEGDAYLTFLSGEAVPAAGVTVYLVPGTSALDSAMADFCAGRRRQNADIQRRYSDATLRDSVDLVEKQVEAALRSRRVNLELANRMDSLHARAKGNFSAWRAATDSVSKIQREGASALMTSRAVATAGTGLHAHFRFDGVTPGRYLMYAEWYVNGYQRRWLAPVNVAARQSVSRDLDNDNLAAGLLDCS